VLAPDAPKSKDTTGHCVVAAVPSTKLMGAP